MAFSEKQLGQAQINDAAPTVLYTLGADLKGIIRDIIITNTTGVAAAIDLWLVPNGGSPGDGNAILKTYNVGANDMVHLSVWQVLETAGDTVQAQAGTATSITITISGAEV